MKANRSLKELLGLHGTAKNLRETAPSRTVAKTKRDEAKAEREFGTVNRWSHEAGWGFAKPHERNFSVFVHVNKIIESAPLMRVGALIEFEIGGLGELSRPYARNIRVIG